MASYRHLSRVAVMQTIFAFDQRKEDIENIFDYILTEFYPEVKKRDFAIKILNGVLNERVYLKELIEKFAPKFEYEKIDLIERIILEIAFWELQYGDAPQAVVMDEAINMAKEFGDEASGKFINGVLSTGSKELKLK